MGKKRLLVLGCGSIGRRHLRNLEHLQSGELIAWDPSPERRADAARETRVRTIASLEEGLADGVDACLVCSPSVRHAEQAVMLAQRCDLFIEKPVATTATDAIAVANAVEAHGRICLVACNLRFHRGLARLKEALDAGAIGVPLSVRAEFGQYLPDWHPTEDYRQGYSARLDLGGGIALDDIHDIDVVRWLCGSYEQVAALRGRVGSLSIEVEDIASLIGRTDRGVWCEIHMDYLQRVYSRSCKVIGSEGTLLWDYPAGQTLLLRPKSDAEVLCDFRSVDPNAMYVSQLEHFLRCLDRQDVPVQSARDAADIVGVVEQFKFI